MKILFKQKQINYIFHKKRKNNLHKLNATHQEKEGVSERKV